MSDDYFSSRSIPVDLDGDKVLDRIDTVCVTYGEDGCLLNRWHRRLVNASPP